MSEPDEAMVEAVAMAANTADGSRDGSGTLTREELEDADLWHVYVDIARAALSVPVVRDALARDAKVAEIVAATREWAGSTDPAPPISYIYADGFDDIAAQYPKEHQPMSKPTRITAEWVAAEKAAAIKSGMTEQAAEELVTKLYASKHVTDGERCWCDPQAETVPAKKSATEAADSSIEGDDQ